VNKPANATEMAIVAIVLRLDISFIALFAHTGREA